MGLLIENFILFQKYYSSPSWRRSVRINDDNESSRIDTKGDQR